MLPFRWSFFRYIFIIPHCPTSWNMQKLRFSRRGYLWKMRLLCGSACCKIGNALPSWKSLLVKANLPFLAHESITETTEHGGSTAETLSPDNKTLNAFGTTFSGESKSLNAWHSSVSIVLSELVAANPEIPQEISASSSIEQKGTNPGFLFQQNTMRDAIVAACNLNIFNKLVTAAGAAGNLEQFIATEVFAEWLVAAVFVGIIFNTNWGGVTEDNSFGTHEFFDLCEQVGCEPYLAGNLGSGTVQELSEWIEYITFDGVGHYLAVTGYNIVYIEGLFYRGVISFVRKFRRVAFFAPVAVGYFWYVQIPPERRSGLLPYRKPNRWKRCGNSYDLMLRQR